MVCCKVLTCIRYKVVCIFGLKVNKHLQAWPGSSDRFVGRSHSSNRLICFDRWSPRWLSKWLAAIQNDLVKKLVANFMKYSGHISFQTYKDGRDVLTGLSVGRIVLAGFSVVGFGAMLGIGFSVTTEGRLVGRLVL